MITLRAGDILAFLVHTVMNKSAFLTPYSFTILRAWVIIEFLKGLREPANYTGLFFQDRFPVLMKSSYVNNES